MAVIVWNVIDKHNGAMTIKARSRTDALTSYFNWFDGMLVIYDGDNEVTDPVLRRAYFDKHYIPDLTVVKIGRA